ncbi:hypothetical protein PIB30_046323 [Stylosanthes scabra]|uniref:F-box domain-containing protein n=1 Tax=Stylosanthes scabra TaxID=79078 RepID=A0ABU6TH85_9FABA|nr:hypothetical protein [Stylosanthes scabra]
MSSSHEGWMDLPMELLELIFQRLSLMDNLMSCRATCRSWRNAAEAVLFSSPLLLRLALESDGGTHDDIIGILSFPWSNHHSIVLTETLWPHHRTCLHDISRVYSVQGWLMLNQFHCVSNNNNEDQTFSELSFFNPLSRARFKLPKLLLFSGTSPPYCQVRLAFNSAPPGSEEFVVVFLEPKNKEQRLAFIRFKQGSWIEIESDEIFYDIAVDYDDKFYGLVFNHDTSDVFVLNLRDYHNELLVMLNTIKDTNFDEFVFRILSYRRYQLAMDTSTGELLLVRRSHGTGWDNPCDSSYTFGFCVFKLERSNLRWCKVFDIGDRFLFWDDTKVSVVSAKELTLPEKFKGGNCIFFCDENENGDIGVFFLADESISRSPKNTSASWLQDMWYFAGIHGAGTSLPASAPIYSWVPVPAGA